MGLGFKLPVFLRRGSGKPQTRRSLRRALLRKWAKRVNLAKPPPYLSASHRLRAIRDVKELFVRDMQQLFPKGGETK